MPATLLKREKEQSKRERGTFVAGVIEDREGDREGEGVGRDLHHPGARTSE